jgi:hypothetical protein
MKGITIFGLLPVAHTLPVFGSFSQYTYMDGYLAQHRDRNIQVRHFNPHIKNRLSSFTHKAQNIVYDWKITDEETVELFWKEEIKPAR